MPSQTFMISNIYPFIFIRKPPESKNEQRYGNQN